MSKALMQEGYVRVSRLRQQVEEFLLWAEVERPLGWQFLVAALRSANTVLGQHLSLAAKHLPVPAFSEAPTVNWPVARRLFKLGEGPPSPEEPEPKQRYTAHLLVQSPAGRVGPVLDDFLAALNGSDGIIQGQPWTGATFDVLGEAVVRSTSWEGPPVENMREQIRREAKSRMRGLVLRDWCVAEEDLTGP